MTGRSGFICKNFVAIHFVAGITALLAQANLCSTATAPSPPTQIVRFLEKRCFECHDADSKKGGLDLTGLPFEVASGGKTFDTWVKVHDRVAEGEMPPKKKGVELPGAGEVDAFLKAVAGPLVEADRVRAAAEGRAVWRRLNRYEYENAVRDLLGAPWLQIKDALPEDGESARFNKVGEALDVSHVQMASYLAAADYALRQVMATQVERPETKTMRYYARDQRSFAGKMKFNEFNGSPERATFPLFGRQGAGGCAGRN